PTPLEENSLVIRTNGDGKYILISPTAEKGFVLLGNGKAYYFGDLDIQGKLTVRGKEVIPGQNGGPSGGGETPGGYPDELKTDAEKRAWR
ncbi:TPA: CHAP domain-containing protein, partial [Enterococcus faecium]|nr:CHAP domain-containing protein [Enterococcus faecium]